MVEHDRTPELHWLPVPGFEGLYEVSDQGDVRSVERKVNMGSYSRMYRGVPIVPSRRKDGRKQYNLSRGNKKTTLLASRLVLLAFKGAPPEGHEACHNNGDDGDNRIENLRWDTHIANIHDKFEHGTIYQKYLTHCPPGHAYTPENTYTFPNGKRTCRECQRARSRKKASEKRAA